MHYLVVHSYDEESGDHDWEIEHEPDCPKDVWYRDPDGNPITEYTCGVGFTISHVGLMDLEESDYADKLQKPGRYPIEFYSHWSGSMFDDSEAYIYFVEDDSPT